MAKEKSLRERLLAQKKDLKSRGEFGMIQGIKADTTIRVRPLPTGAEKDFGMEVHYVFMNKDLGGFVSPATWGEKCAFSLRAEKMAKSGNEKEKKFAKDRISPRKKFLVPCLKFKDMKGLEPDRIILLQLPAKLYEQMLDLWLDEDEAGDFTDPIKGYDLKVTRTGSTMTDTKYSLLACKTTKLDKKYRKDIDLDAMVRKETPDYETTREKLKAFMNVTDISSTNRVEEESKSDRIKKKKKKSRDM